MTNVLNRQDLAASAALFAAACALSRRYNALAAEALAKYGDHGGSVSGCVRDHFPEYTKGYLRSLAARVGKASSDAWRSKPARVHHSTMLALSRAVAQRDGSGFYGPQE